MKKAEYLSIGLLAGVSALALAPVAYAQAAPPADAGQVEEIVVTANKRSENLQQAPLAISAVSSEQLELRGRAAARLKGVTAPFTDGCFYAVGGAWRNLALLHMRLGDYRLGVVQQYEITAQDALSTVRLIAAQSRPSLDRIEGMSRKRAETLPFAALVLEALIEQLGFKRIVVSAFGLREGLVFDALPQHLKARDPLVEGCAALGARQGEIGRAHV